MKYKIIAEQYLKRFKWFANEDFGIGITYWWNGSKNQVTIDMDYVEEGCEDEVTSIIEPCYKVIHDEVTVDIDYPSPNYFSNPEKGVIWNIPKIEKAVSKDGAFAITMHSNYLFEKAAKLEEKKQKNAWGTIGDDFKWDIPRIKPSAKQVSIEYQNMADIWLSTSWVTDKKLDKFMFENFGMKIDEDYLSFYAPKVISTS